MITAFKDTPEFWKQLGERVVKNVRLTKFQSRWVAVSKATGHGSSYSRDLCRYFGLDPDETKSMAQAKKTRTDAEAL